MNEMTSPKAQHNVTQKGQTRVLIYTDGSCLGNPGPGGWAALLIRTENGIETKRRAISGFEIETTNNRMEIRAAIAALRCLKKDETAPITIRTDSTLLVRGVTEWLPNWVARNWRKSDGKPVLNHDLWEELIVLTKGRNITWEWVKGHAGEARNEKVDRLAKAAAQKAASKLDA